MADRFVYLFDPMCGWCYGASTGIAKLAGHPGVVVEPLATGLFAGDGARTLTATMASHILASDARIATLTGAVFGDAYRRLVTESGDIHLDSGPATLALAAVAQSAPSRVIEALGLIQRARYVAGRDIADRAMLSALLAEAGMTQAAEAIAAPSAALQAADDAGRVRAQSLMRQFGLNGVPALLRDRAGILTPVDSAVLYADPLSLVSAAEVGR